MSWFQSIIAPWKVDDQTTTQPDRRSQNTCEDRSLESRRHFSHPVDVEARLTAIPSNLRLPSRDVHQRQNQLHTSHRISASFNREPISCEATTVPVRHERSRPDAAHSVVSPVVPAAHVAHSVTAVSPVAPAAYVAHSVNAVRPVASRSPVPHTISYTQASKTVLLPTEQRVPRLAHLPPSATASSPAQESGTNTARLDNTASFDNRMQHIQERDPVPTATHADQLGATQATSQGAAARTATADVTRTAAGGKGPSGSRSDGPSNDSEEDITKSAFYRNGRFTRHTLPIEALRTDHGMEKLPMRAFGGDVREYHQFRDSFLNGVESQPHLRPFQKLQHLLELLEGEPRLWAEGYGICDVAYWEVLSMLEAHYGDNIIIQNTLRQDFIDMLPPTEQPADLLNFLEDSETLIGRLKRTGIDVDQGEIYCSLLMGHLPVPLRLKLIQGYGCRGATKVSCVLDGLRLYLSDVKEAEERPLTLRRPCKAAEDPPVLDHRQFGHEEPSPPPTTSERCQQTAPSEADVDSATHPAETTVNSSSNDHLKERRPCALCGILSHFAANCFNYPTIQKRLRRVLKLKICLLCLRGGHQASVCPHRTKNSCKTCGHGQHHRILCKDADDSSRRKTRRSSQMRATTGSSRHPANSDHLRHFRKKNKSVTRNVTSIVTSAPLRKGKGTQRSLSTRCKGNPTTDRKKRTRNQGATSKGQAGTARPSTNSSDERKQQTATASGNRGLLPARHGQLPTEPSSTTDESTKFHRERREAEEDSSTQLSGGDSDNQALPPQDPAGSTALRTQTDAIYCASSTTEPTTLLECIKATAENPVTGNSREALIFFDSGSSRSFVSMELACELNLPRQRPRSCRVHIFGSKLPSTIEGFSTSIVLSSKHRRLPPLAVIAGDCIVPSVRAALVEKEDLPRLRRSELSPSPIQVTPDILIGQDLASLFKRQYGSTLPSGFYIVHSILGPMLGGSAAVPTTAREAATSPKAASTARGPSHRTPTRTDATPHSPKLPPPTHGKQSPAHSVGSCNAIAKRSDATLSVEQDLESPSDAAHQNFSQPVEKNKFYRSTTSTSCRTDRHPLSGFAKGSTPPRKLQNPLDTSAPLPPPTTHVTLQQELRTDPSAQTPCEYVTARPSHSSSQQNPALNKPRKTRLRRRSTTFGQTVLGTENQGELRKCDSMRFLPDQPRPATDTPTHAVPGSTDPDAHYENRTSTGPHLPDVVYVAAAQTPIDRRQAAETPNSSSTARRGADSAAVPSPAHSVGREQAQEPRSTQKCQSTQATYGANDDLQGAEGQPSPTSTGSGQRELVNRRVSTHAQEGQLSRSARRTTSAAAIHDPSIPIVDGFVSKSYATLLATSQDDAYRSPAVIEDLPPQYEFVGSINHLGVPTSYLPTQFRRTAPTDDFPLASVTFDQLIQENNILPWKFILSSTLGALPPYWEMATADACLHLHEEAQGSTYHGLPICGIGPTGFFLNAESDDTFREYEGQRQALLRFGRIARNTGKCLVLVIYNEPKTGIDLHCEAIRLLCQEVQLLADHRIHLVAYRASSLQLQLWLATFSNVVLGLDQLQLSSLFLALRSTTDRTESYVHALQLQELFTNLPLKHFALHSGCPSTQPNGHPGHFQTPITLLKTAELFEQLTGTPQDVLLAWSANNLNTIYQLSINLPDCTMTACSSRDESRGRHFTEDLSARPHLALGPACRADHADQAISASYRSPPLNTAHSVVPAVLSPPAARQMCAFCNDAHSPTECMTFQEVNKRMRRLQALKRCFICLATGHPSSKCPERTTSLCRYCKRGQHHSSLCRSPEARHAADASGLLPTAADQRPDVAPDAAHSVAKGAGSTLRTPNAAHSVAKGAGPTPRTPDAAHSVAPGTFPPALNHFRVDQTSSTKKAGTRAAPRSAKRRSAAVSTTPAQAPSKQPSRPTSKRTTAKSSGKRRQVHATIAADLSSTDHRQEPPAETPARQIQHADVRCELCAERHRAEQCTSFPSIEERRQRAQYLWLCFTCLAKDHRTEDCPNIDMFSCILCDYDNHHHALCAAARSHATDAAEASSMPVVVPAEAHKRPLAPHRAEDLHQSSFAAVQRPTGHAVPAVTAEDLQQEPTMAEDRRDLQQEPTMAEDRRAPKRQNRKPKK